MPLRRLVSILSVLTLGAGLAACSTRIEGRIDVPGNATGGIAVRVIPASELVSYLAQRVPEALTTLDERRTAYERSQRAADLVVRDYQRAIGGAKAVSVTKDGVRVTNQEGDRPLEGIYTYDPKAKSYQEAQALARAGVAEASAQRAANAARFAEEKASLDQDLASGRALLANARLRLLAWEKDMLADLPQKGTVVNTDANGRFSVSLPRKGRAAVFASGDFTIEGEPQHRVWALWVRLDEATRALTLDASNMLLSEPAESVLR